MNSWDEDPRVRRISIEKDGDQTPTEQDRATPRHNRPRRPWLPLVISGLTVAIAIVVVSVSGGLRFDDPIPQDPERFASRSGDVEPTDAIETAGTTTTSTLALRLDELLPGLSDRLTFIATTEEEIRSLVWDPSFRFPVSFGLAISPMSNPRRASAAFDSGGRSLAVLVNTSTGRDIWAGTPTDVGDSPDITQVSSWVWNATEVGAIAWMGFPNDPNGGLSTGSISPLTGNLVDVKNVSRLTTPGGIVRWDNQGFIVNDIDAIRAINDDGSIAWERAGVALSASSSFVIAQVPDASTGNLGFAVLDRTDGELTAEIGTMPETSQGDVWVGTSRNTGLIATVKEIDSRSSSLTVRGDELAAPRIIRIDQNVRPIGFTTQGEFFVFDALDSADLVFVNWRTGAIRSVPLPDEYNVIALDLG